MQFMFKEYSRSSSSSLIVTLSAMTGLLHSPTAIILGAGVIGGVECGSVWMLDAQEDVGFVTRDAGPEVTVGAILLPQNTEPHYRSRLSLAQRWLVGEV
eukprot:scaffold26357_cov78-Skeletonema_dohrnii-CCMP3373.AAC.1